MSLSKHSVEKAQQLASSIAARFDVFECDRCAVEIAKALGKMFPAYFERLRTSDKSHSIGLAEEGIQISANGLHLGIRIADRIFDNLHQTGIDGNNGWAGSCPQRKRHWNVNPDPLAIFSERYSWSSNSANG
jgi:hypothetical protein